MVNLCVIIASPFLLDHMVKKIWRIKIFFFVEYDESTVNIGTCAVSMYQALSPPPQRAWVRG